MKCQEVLDVLSGETESMNVSARRFAEEHLLRCESCQAAFRAVRALREEREAWVRPPAAGAFERAMRVATQHPPRVRPSRTGFWLGAALGGALAAGLALVLVLTVPGPRAPLPVGTPQVRLAPNQTRTLRISLDAPEAMPQAQIRVALSGAVGLVGYEGKKELAWQTDLDRGVNQLSLPIVALGGEGGQLVVEVRYGEKRKRFLVDVLPTHLRPPA